MTSVELGYCMGDNAYHLRSLNDKGSVNSKDRKEKQHDAGKTTLV